MIPLTTQQLAEAAHGTLHGASGVLVTSISTDSRRLVEGCLFVALVGGNFDGHSFVEKAAAAGAAAVMISSLPATPLSIPAILVPDTLLGLQALAADHRKRWGGIVVGLTGSNGKTSTKDLAKAVLERLRPTLATQGNLNNHIGLPLTCLSVTAEHKIGVFEMGMNHFGEIAPLAAIAKPDVAIITNIGTAHIEFLGSREGIALEKGALLEALGPEGMAILNADDDFVAALKARHTGPTLTAGHAENADVRITNCVSSKAGTTFCLTFPDNQTTEVSLPLPGRHMVGNAALAAAAGWHLGLRAEEIKAGLEQATLNKGRLSFLHVGGVPFLDDSYNANPDSMLAGLATVREMTLPAAGRRVAVLGRMGELGEHSHAGHAQVGTAAAQADLHLLCVVGQDDSRYTAEAAAAAGQALVTFPDHLACAQHLASMALGPDDLVYVKGSRSAAMEKVIQHFQTLIHTDR